MPRHTSEKVYIKSGPNSIYVELGFPKKTPAPAVVVAHGLRSYYTGFLDNFAKRFRDAGYISVKFHFVGTGKSSGKFEDKSTEVMLQNYKDVIAYLESRPDIHGIGVVGRSNAGTLSTLASPDMHVKAYVMLAAPAYYSKCLSIFQRGAKVVGNFFYHPSFKRPHTKGEGRLPIDFVEKTKKFDATVLENIKKIKPVLYFQSTADEASTMADGHFDYWKKNLPNPHKVVLIEGGNHSFKGRKSFVIEESIRWFKKYLPK